MAPAITESLPKPLTVVLIMGDMEQEHVLLGKRITAARLARGWSRSELARRAGVDPSYVTRIEKAEYKRPSVDKVTQVATALGIRVTELTDPPTVAPIPPGIEAELAALFRPDEAPLVAEILRGWARHDEKTRRFLLSTMKPLVLDFPDTDSQTG